MAAHAGIRPAAADDLDGLLALYRQLNPDDPVMPEDLARSRFAQMLAQPGLTVFVAALDGRAVSSVTLVVVPNLTRAGASYALIENVVTDAGHRRRGHAAALIREATEAAWNAGCYKVMLLTGRKDPETLRFYSGCGFMQDKTGFQIRRPIPPARS